MWQLPVVESSTTERRQAQRNLVNLFHVFWKQLRLLGSTMGSPADFSAMLDFVTHHRIEPVIDRIFPLADVNEAIDRLGSSEQFGKLVLEI